MQESAHYRYYYNFRVQALTHVQVEEMAAQVATIADEHHLTDDASTVPEDISPSQL